LSFKKNCNCSARYALINDKPPCLWGRFERHRSEAEVRREDDGTVPLARQFMPEQLQRT